MSDDPHNQIQIKLDDHEIFLRESSTHIGIVQADSVGDVTIRISDGWHRTELDLSFEDLRRLSDVVRDAINNAFDRNADIKCSACGYTAADADFHGDHKQCRNYPLFPNEQRSRVRKR